MSDTFNNIDLIRSLQEKDDVSAFNVIFTRYHQILYHNICKLVHNPAAAEDILQEVFTSMWQLRTSLDPLKPVANWLFVVSFNKSMSWLKKNIREAKKLEEAFGHAMNEQVQLPVTTERDYEGKLQMLERLIKQLPVRKRTAFVLHKLEGKSYNEVGELLGISPDTVKEYVKDSNKLLKQHVAKTGGLNIVNGIAPLILFLTH